MTILDDRRMEILARMGVQLWRPRLQQQSGEAHPSSSGDVPIQAAGPDSDAGQSEYAGPGMAARTQLASTIPEAAMPETAVVSLEEIAEAVRGCERCRLHTTRIKTVPGHGNRRASWMFVGEAPGHNEDEQGLPFVGKAGQLLNAMIEALGMERSDVFVVNALKCRPPGNRDPQADELAQCEPYLHQQLALIQPRVIVALGRISAQSLLKTGEPLGKIRNVIHHYGPQNIPLVATYHPAYLLRSPDQKAKSWQDLLLAKSVVNRNTV